MWQAAAAVPPPGSTNSFSGGSEWLNCRAAVSSQPSALVVDQRAARYPQLPAEIEQIVLHLGQTGRGRASGSGIGQQHADGAVGFVDRCRGFDCAGYPCDPRAVAEARGAVIARCACKSCSIDSPCSTHSRAAAASATPHRGAPQHVGVSMSFCRTSGRTRGAARRGGRSRAAVPAQSRGNASRPTSRRSPKPTSRREAIRAGAEARFPALWLLWRGDRPRADAVRRASGWSIRSTAPRLRARVPVLLDADCAHARRQAGARRIECPAYGELAWAEQAQGALLDGGRMRVGAVATLAAAILSAGNLKTLAASAVRWSRLATLVGSVNRLRGYGDFLHYHLLARGALDVVLESRRQHPRHRRADGDRARGRRPRHRSGRRRHRARQQFDPGGQPALHAAVLAALGPARPAGTRAAARVPRVCIGVRYSSDRAAVVSMSAAVRVGSAHPHTAAARDRRSGPRASDRAAWR